MKQYTYDAFISYRHTELDIFAAENLHKQLEAFRLPGKIAKKKKDERTHIERVFRDKDELPLTSNLEDPIMVALKESEYLIVICSPRLRESLWCKKEIETFISLHGREKVLAVLIEGEPDQSFPEALLYIEEKVEHPDGTFEIVKKTAEPLAADIRGKDKHAMIKAMRTEILRLLAPIFGLNFDDLRQRHRERRMKRILTASVFGGSICLAFGTVSTVMALRIHNQKEQIEVQSEEINNQNQSLLINQAINLSDESMRQLEEGDRISAINTAVEAITTYKGIEMPYTPGAQLALTESLHAYDSDSYIKPCFQLDTVGVIDYMTLSPDRKILLTYDCTGCITLWNVITGDIISEIRDLDSFLYSEKDVTFLGNDRLAYKNAEGNVSIYSIESQSVIKTMDVEYLTVVCSDISAKYLMIKDFDSINIYDANTFLQIYKYKPQQDYSLCNDIYINDEAAILVFQETIEDGSMFLRFLDLTDGSFSDLLPVDCYRMDDIQFDGDIVYMLMNQNDVYFDNLSTKVAAYEMSSQKKLWETVYEGLFGSEIYKPYAEAADKLLLLTGGEAFLIDEKDGSEYGYFSLGSSTAGGAVYTQKDIYIAFTRSGEYHSIFVEDKQDYIFDGQFQCHSQNVKKFLVSADNFLILPYMDNHVTVYNYSAGFDLKDYTEVVPEAENKYLEYQDAVNAASEMELPKAALTRYVFYNEDKSVMYVVYSDNSMEIYSTADLKLLNYITELKDDPRWFAGEDQAGHSFIRGVSYGYMLDENDNLIGVIEGLEHVNKEEDVLVIRDDLGAPYTMPIYTLEELLAKAEPYVLR